MATLASILAWGIPWTDHGVTWSQTKTEEGTEQQGQNRGSMDRDLNALKNNKIQLSKIKKKNKKLFIEIKTSKMG